MSAYTYLTIRFPGIVKGPFGHWLFWTVYRLRRHIEETRKAFDDAGK